MRPPIVPCIVPKVSHGQKLKALPLETKVLLVLLSRAERRVEKASHIEMAANLGVVPQEIGVALESLMRARCLVLEITGPHEFKFALHADVRRTLVKHAASFDTHLKAKEAKNLRVTTNAQIQASRIPDYCPPINDAQREPHLETAKALSERLGAPAFATKMANCIVRIGVEEVEKLANLVLEDKSELSARKRFVRLYVKRRDVLLAPKK